MNKTKLIAEYIWLDGNNNFRSKAQTLEITSADDLEIDNLPLSDCNGRFTNQFNQNETNVILKPVSIFNCPFRGGNNVMILCETYLNSLDNPTKTNTRYEAVQRLKEYEDSDPFFGFEQEYFIINPSTRRPLGFPLDGYPECRGSNYCGLGVKNIFGRKIADLHYKLCLEAGVKLAGINAGVTPGQWVFKISQSKGIDSSDHLMIARYLLERIAELNNVLVSFEPKVLRGNWNSSGCHISFSTIEMREGIDSKTGLDYINEGIKKLSNSHEEHMRVYGENNRRRLTGRNRTSNYNLFTKDGQNSSVVIPRETKTEEQGYFIDRRPGANVDPYKASMTLFKTLVLS